MVALRNPPRPRGHQQLHYLGYHMAGFWGALVSTVAVVLPSFLIIFAISLVFDQFLAISYVNYAFQGIRSAWYTSSSAPV